MPLATLKEVLLPARAGGYAVGAFNANNMEFVQAIVEAARRSASPVIVQASQGAISYAGLEFIVEMVKSAAAGSAVPVVLHLDHGTDLDMVRRCIDAGFTSVMFDGSKLPFEENVKLTRQVAAMAHEAGISAEGELGRVPSSGQPLTAEEIEAMMTDPRDAALFVSETQIDALAVAVGSVHQMKKQTALLDIQRVKAISEKVEVPLVLHGSSGVSPGSIREAVREGICKVNVATRLNMAFSRRLGEEISRDPGQVDPRKILGPAREAVMAVVLETMDLLGSKGKAS